MERDSIKDFLDSLSEMKKETKSTESSKKNGKFQFVKFAPYILIGIVGILFAIYFGREFLLNLSLSKHSDKAYLVTMVSRLVELPDEDPMVVTVTNSDVLSRQIFFKDVQVGDKLLVFKASKKAVLYRPSTDKIVSIAPLN